MKGKEKGNLTHNHEHKKEEYIGPTRTSTFSHKRFIHNNTPEFTIIQGNNDYTEFEPGSSEQTLMLEGGLPDCFLDLRSKAINSLKYPSQSPQPQPQPQATAFAPINRETALPHYRQYFSLL